MTDFDKEFDLLSQYLDYRIDLVAKKLNRPYIIFRLECLPKHFDVDELFKFYSQTGILFVDSTPDPEPIDTYIISFTEWKLYIHCLHNSI